MLIGGRNGHEQTLGEGAVSTASVDTRNQRGCHPRGLRRGWIYLVLPRA